VIGDCLVQKRLSNFPPRVQVVPLLTTIFKTSVSYPEKLTCQLSLSINLALKHIWTAAQRTSPDVLNDCFISSIYSFKSVAAFSKQNSKAPPTEYLKVISIVADTMAKAILSAANVRKVSQIM
jgi:hypothetical protein